MKHVHMPAHRGLRSLLIVILVGCSAAWMARSHGPNSANRTRLEVGYPSGTWWQRDISSVLHCIDHILITHTKSETSASDLRVPSDAIVSRTVEEAQALASKLALQLARDPSEFRQLAEKYSDDPLSAKREGRLGIVRNSNLPKSLVDAIGHLDYEQISRPVPTTLGFHILRKRRVPPAEIVQGSELVILYEGLSLFPRPGRTVSRSREEARDLAQELFAQLRAAPNKFDQFVEQYSDAPSAVQKGDIGEWSTHDCCDSVALDILANLNVGELSPILDDPSLGFRILRRDHRQRQELAATPILVGYHRPDRPDASLAEPRSREESRALADEILREALLSPDSFDRLRDANCDFGMCRRKPRAYKEGRSPWSGLDDELLRVDIGAIVPRAVETPMGYVIAKREDPVSYRRHWPPAPTELPSPPRLTWDTATVGHLGLFLSQALEHVVKNVRLTHDEATTLKASLKTLMSELSTAQTPDQRRAMLDKRATEVRQFLGKERWDQTCSIMKALDGTLQGP